MKTKPLLIGAAVFATISIAGASAWMVNAGFISSTGVTDAEALVATTSIVPAAKLQLPGATPDSTPVSTAWPTSYPDGSGFCDAAKNPANYPEPAKILSPGKNGWVFRQDELEWPAKLTDPSLHRVVQSLQKYLAKTNTKLIILINPPRIITGATHLAGVGTNKISTDRAIKFYNNLLADLRKDGAYVPDILAEADFNKVAWDLLSDPADFRWSALGAQMAANATSRIIQSDDRFKNILLTKFKIERNGSSESVSDYFDILADICESKSLSKKVATFHENNAGHITMPSGTSKISDSIIITGTSFTAMDRRYNYSGFLSEGIGVKVGNLSLDSSSPVQSLLTYLSSGELARIGPRFLIWEMSPQNLPDANNLAQIEAYADPGCSLLSEASVNFDWNETQIFHSENFRKYAGGRAKLLFKTSNKSLRDFKIITHFHDGRVDQVNVDFSRSKTAPDSFGIVFPDISGVKAISIKPVGMMTGKIKAQLCGMDA